MSESRLNSSKGIKAILRGHTTVVIKKKNFQYTLQQKKKILNDYEAAPQYRGKQRDWTAEYGVDKNFFKKTAKTIAKLRLIDVDLSSPRTGPRPMVMCSF
jgi:hypothetical protein